jgi:hypothetical protein
MILLAPQLSHAEQQYNVISSITIKGIEITRPITKKQLDFVFQNKFEDEKSSYFSECTANYVLKFSGSGYEDGSFEIFPEDNHNVDTRELNVEKLSKSPDIKGSLWITIDSKSISDYAVLIDNEDLPPSLTFREFERKYPFSAKSTSHTETEKDVKAFVVLFGENEDNNGKSHPNARSLKFDEEVAYVSSIVFLFKNDVLYKISIWQGIAC